MRIRGAHPGRLLLGAYVLLVVVFLLAPIITIAVGALTDTAYVVFPPQGITLRWYVGILNQPDFLGSLGLSLGVAATSGTVGTVFGLMVGIALVRHPSNLSRATWLVLMSPLMFPSIVLGMAFLEFYGRFGLGNNPLALLAGHVVLVTPFATSLILVGLESVDPALERAARSLGARPWQVHLRITLPLISWSLVAGWALAFMMSFGDLAVSLFMATPTLVTLPVRIYNSLEWSPLDPSLTAVASGLIIITVVVLIVAARIARPERLLQQRSHGGN